MTIVHLAGHLGADPEVRTTPSGQKVTTFRLAVNSRKGKEDVTVWWKVTIWGDQFDRMMPYIKKGSGLMIVGEMSPPELYVDRDGNHRYTPECIAFQVSFHPFGRSDKRENDGNGMNNNSSYSGMVETGGPRQAAPGYASSAAPRPVAAVGIPSDEVPF